MGYDRTFLLLGTVLSLVSGAEVGLAFDPTPFEKLILQSASAQLGELTLKTPSQTSDLEVLKVSDPASNAESLVLFAQSTSAAYYQQGVEAFRQREFQRAIDAFTQAIAADPNFANAYYSRGLARRQLGDNSGAIADYSEAIRLNPSFDSAYNNRGVIYSAQGQYQLALEDFNQAIQIDPKNVNAYYGRGFVRRQLEDNQGAMADFTKVIELDPANANAYYSRGLHNRSLGETEAAIADFKKAADLYKQQGQTAQYEQALNQLSQLQGRPESSQSL